MYHQFRRSSLLRRYVVYNFCFVLIPVLSLICIYFNSALKQIIHEFEISQESALLQTMKTVDDSMETFSLVATQLSNDPDLTPYQLKHLNYDTIQALKQLKSYHSHANFLDDMYLYIYGEEKLYSGTGITSFSTFSNNIYYFQDKLNMEDFIKLLNNSVPYGIYTSNGNISKRNGDEKYIAVTYPWSSATFASFGTVLGILNISYFEDLISGIDSDINGSLFILDQNGNPIASQQDLIGITTEDIKRISLQTDSFGANTVKVDSSNYSAIVLQSQKNHWYYISIFPTGQFAKRFIESNTPIVAFVSVLLILCIVFGFLMALRNYRPIYNLNMMLNHNTSSQARKNELEEIQQSCQKMLQRNETMRRELDENRDMLSERMIYKILTGTCSFDSQSDRRKLEYLNINICGPYYCVLVIRTSRKPQPQDKVALISSIRSAQINNFYCIEMDYQGYIAVLFNTSSSKEARQVLVPAVLESICLYSGEQYYLGVGHSYDSSDMINRSLMEAISACEFSISRGECDVSYFDELKTQRKSSPAWYPPKAQLRLYQGLSQANRTMVYGSILEIESIMSKHYRKADDISIRFMINGIIQQIWSLVDEYKLKDGDSYIDDIIHYTDTNDFAQQLRVLCEQIITAVNDKKCLEQNSIYHDIIAYIEKEYCSQDMSLKKIADMFHMTDSYLSRFFRDCSGKNFIDYITEKRMEKACTLLRETELRVRDVMDQVGYIDLASFTRKFTQVIGTSPGKYRSAINKKKQ